jgi:tRNA 2-thiocytidine biosynthesis protein TtcA
MYTTAKLPIATPPWTGLGRRLESLVRKALHDFQMLEGVRRVGVALSGGKDSLSLLFLLKAILGRGLPLLDLVALHIDGAFSCGAGLPRGYLAAICEELNVPLVVRSSKQQLDSLECYSCSRERRSLLFEAAREVGAEVVAFGHHKDDSVETLLLNLLHKGEFAALLPNLAMVHYGVRIIRPLIFASEEELRQFAQQYAFNRITCQCPVGARSKRREVKNLVNQLQLLFPNARDNLAQAGLLQGLDKARRA